jgi:hypothetical protein
VTTAAQGRESALISTIASRKHGRGCASLIEEEQERLLLRAQQRKTRQRLQHQLVVEEHFKEPLQQMRHCKYYTTIHLLLENS